MAFYYKRSAFALERTGRANESFLLNTVVGLVSQSINKWYSSSSLISTTKATVNKPYKINILNNKNVFYLFRAIIEEIILNHDYKKVFV